MSESYPKIMTASPPKRTPHGPHSRAFRGGSLSDRIDGRSRAGKFLRRVEQELLGQLGGEPSVAQTLLVRRAARALWLLDELDFKLAEGDSWTDCDSRVMGGLNNNVRLLLRELGIKAAQPKKPSLAEYLQQRAGK